ncbi:hypothetical protein STEG23_036223 [Scotinomys teguina]
MDTFPRGFRDTEFSPPKSVCDWRQGFQMSLGYKCISMNGRANGSKWNKSTSQKQKNKQTKQNKASKRGQGDETRAKRRPSPKSWYSHPRLRSGDIQKRGGPRGPVRQVDDHAGTDQVRRKEGHEGNAR